MKKLLAIAVALVAFATVASAQPRAIGLRAGFGGEISYQHSIGNDFLEFDLGLYGNSAALSMMYDFVLVGNGAFNFYAGPGARVGTWIAKDCSGLDLGIAGQIGFEYNFNVPLQISIDWRPTLHFLGTEGYRGFYATDAALAFRYKF